MLVWARSSLPWEQRHKEMNDPWQALLEAAKAMLLAETDEETGRALLGLTIAVDQVEREQPSQGPHPLGKLLPFKER